MLRDVRQGSSAPATERPAGRALSGEVTSEELSRRHELLAQVIGKSVVIVPAAAVLAFGLWTGYEAVAGQGVSLLQAILLSAGSLALTVGLAFVWAGLHGRGSS
jgi:hypothetical protein